MGIYPDALSEERDNQLRESLREVEETGDVALLGWLKEIFTRSHEQYMINEWEDHRDITQGEHYD